MLHFYVDPLTCHTHTHTWRPQLTPSVPGRVSIFILLTMRGFYTASETCGD
ncbi:hypothetical protein E2C01_024633 [Portunus trituberculatus]|uniref:Uncharacterized protein n=1 Tax=Portunus trituberculatus TaxID=210409 RepID=A0A5B7EDP8_PORTR|nr:hypothetical protein [Portunus trituberculatus]